jgi:class 3 adenylate cyclase/tetratricopeptide (TPR) repeat protein
MKCLECQFENPDRSKFCLECGTRFEVPCPECGNQLPPTAKFCNECGHDLRTPTKPTSADLSFDEKIAKIQRYLPEGLTEKILSQRDRIEGERKQVTVMFCDMEGFTALTERLGPEEAYSIMDQVYEILIHKVHDYEGTVNEMTGDGIVALFGAPIALEGAPQRAIRSAMAIHRGMAKFSDRIRGQKAGIPVLKMRVGIHSGPVVVGTLGNDLRVEFKAVGDTVNLASRMEELARPGTTYVTEDTYKLTEGLFRFEALGGKEIKGKEEPVDVYQVIVPSTRRTRFDVSAERGLTPFVGRERELELLLDGYGRAKSGRGQAFSIVSEAGVGKSRLLYEFRKSLMNEDVTFLEGRCLSYSRGVAYHAIADILKGNFDIQDSDGQDEIRRKVGDGLKILEADKGSTLPYLLELLSVQDSGIDHISMSPEGKRDQITEALKRITLMGSQIRPLVMAIEDLHWADKGSEEVLKSLIGSVAGARVLLIFTYRPEFVHTWGSKSYHSQLTLNRLSNRESLAMVTYLLGTENIDPDLQELILEKTEGMPFFIEEFVRSLKDLEIIDKHDSRYHLKKDIQQVTIPSKIQDVIMARVDSLPTAAREVLQTASVIEREFSYPLIRRVTGLPEQEVLKHLSTLRDSEILYERGIYPETLYIFKHALTQDVVYDSILTEKKKKLHRQIAQTMEQMYKETMGEHSGIVAEHFIRSGDHGKGAEYSKIAGRMARRKSAYTDAVYHATREVSCLEKLRGTDDDQKRLIDARTTLASYCMSLNHHFEAKEAVDPIADLAIQLNYEKRLPTIHTAIGSYFLYVEEDYPAATTHLQKAVELSDKVRDYNALWFSNYFLGAHLSTNCDFDRGLAHFESALRLSEAAGVLSSASFAKGTMSALNHCYRGEIKLAYDTSKEAVQIAEDINDMHVKGMAYTCYGISCYLRGILDEADKYLSEGEVCCEITTHFTWGAFACEGLGHLHVLRGEYARAAEHYRKAIVLLESNRFSPSLIEFNRLSLARARVLNNDKDIGPNDFLEYHPSIKARSHEGWAARYVAEIFLKYGAQYISEAKHWNEKAIAADTRNGTMFQLGQDYALLGEVLTREGNMSKAIEILRRAIEIYRNCGANGWLEKAEKKLSELSA